MEKTLVVLLGPTGIGKTELCLTLAEMLKCPILNCDSRQLYKGIEIGTAAPTPQQQQRVKHYFVGMLDIHDYFSAAQYEDQALQLCQSLFLSHDTLLLSGGSMLYIDAVCKGIDNIPTIDEQTREWMKKRLEEEGLEKLYEELKRLDPAYSEVVDPKNTRRIVHALEICHMTGQTYTSFRTSNKKERPFKILKIGLQRPREELFQRINQRVELMLKDGLLDEAVKWYPQREANALNTVGYKELFEYLDNKDLPESERKALQMKGRVTSLEEAKERIKKNTRVYAKKQMTWFAHDNDIHWFHPDQLEDIKEYISNNIQ